MTSSSRARSNVKYVYIDSNIQMRAYGLFFSPSRTQGMEYECSITNYYTRCIRVKYADGKMPKNFEKNLIFVSNIDSSQLVLAVDLNAVRESFKISRTKRQRKTH